MEDFETENRHLLRKTFMEGGAQPRDTAGNRLNTERLRAHFVPAVYKVSDDVAYDAVGTFSLSSGFTVHM